MLFGIKAITICFTELLRGFSPTVAEKYRKMPKPKNLFLCDESSLSLKTQFELSTMKKKMPVARCRIIASNKTSNPASKVNYVGFL